MFLDQYLVDESGNKYSKGPKLDEVGVLTAVMEAEEIFSDYTVALIRAEHESIVSENAQVLEEAVADWIDKIKEFFEKLWNAVKKFATWVWGQITSVFMKRDAWVKKYSTEIDAGAAKAAKKTGVQWTVKKSDVAFGVPAISNVQHSIQKKKVEDLEAGYDALKDVLARQDEKSNIKGSAITSYVAACKKFVMNTKMRDTKKLFDNVLKDIKIGKENAVKAAKVDKDTATVNKERKMASLKARMVQAEYRAVSSAYSYAYSICKKAYNYNTFGREEK